MREELAAAEIASHGLAPDAVGPEMESGLARIVGITGEGAVLLAEDFDLGPGRPIIGLPSIAFEPSRERLGTQLAARFPAELGYEARELVAMKSEFGGGDCPRAPFFLAPLLKPSGWRARLGFVPGIREVPLREVRMYLRERSREGALVDPRLRQGLFLAEEFFPQWASVRLSRAVAALETRRAAGLVHV